MSSQAPPSELLSYCINLDERPEKWEQIQADFKNTGLNVARFPAIKHAKGWIGCGQSHVALARLAKQKGLEWILIVEDDCQPMPWFNERWPQIKKALWEERASWDIFLGGPTYIQGPIDPIRPELVKITQGLTTHFYVLNATAYDKVIAWNPDRDGSIDWYFSNTLRTITTSPFLAIQRPSFSDIAGKDMNYNNIFKESQNQLTRLQYAKEARGTALALVVLGGLLIWMLRR